MQNIELFALTAVEVDWREGVKESIGFAGDLITISESPVGGRNIRFATGLTGITGMEIAHTYGS